MSVQAGTPGSGRRDPRGARTERTTANRSSTPSPRASIFANFETVQLSTEERLYLHAARLGDALLLKEVIESDVHNKLNANCVDYMGRNALHLAVDSENSETIEILLERVTWECMEDALLHAISKGSLNVVRIIVDHPNYMSGEENKNMKVLGQKKDAIFFRKEEKYQYPPEITPLILAAHKNEHEMVQLFLSRGHTIDRPHAIHCKCQDCSVKQLCDSLKRSRARLNAYKALASPAYMALSSPDPITTTFELRQEMMQVSYVEKEFKNEYLALVEQCMDFACEIMDLCRGTQEVEAMLGVGDFCARDPLARLRLAIMYNEKKFVAHSNCQQHLTSIWYGKEMSMLQSIHWTHKLLIFLIIPFLPFFCIYYIVFSNSNSKVAKIMRCPVSKFIMHTTSHFAFLGLLTVATFGLEDMVSIDGVWSSRRDPSGDIGNPGYLMNNSYMYLNMLRPERSSVTRVQILIIFWITGLVWIECKQIYQSGHQEHFMQYYNYLDFTILALYLASYSLRFVALYRVSAANVQLNATQRVKELLAAPNSDAGNFSDLFMQLKEVPSHGYFMSAVRFDWEPHDPEILSDVLFAVANVLSFARTMYVMPSHELLGPLQISLGRMLGDIARFVVIFLLTLFSFMVGMTNLYRYYGTHTSEDGKPAIESFKGLAETIYTLFFSIFGLIPLNKLKVDVPNSQNDSSNNALAGTPTWRTGDEPASTTMVDQVGLILFALYQVTVTIVLVNMLIAMMSHSFEAIQGDCDVEWKFARTQLWMNYIEEGSTLPVPFNMIPTIKSIQYALSFVKDLCPKEEIVYDYSRRRGNLLPSDLDPISAGILVARNPTYTDILQRLVRRYLFKMERDKTDNEKIETICRAEEYDEEEGDRLPRPVGAGISLVPIDEDADPEPENEAKVSFCLPNGDTTLRETRSEHQLVPPPPPGGESEGARRHSDSTLRQLTRRATIRRGSSKHSVARPANTVQLDSIQRGQRVLDARLQDLQSFNKSEEETLNQNITHVRHLLTESQKAMGSLVMTMGAMQSDMQNTTHILTAMFNYLMPDSPLQVNPRTGKLSANSEAAPGAGGGACAGAGGEPGGAVRFFMGGSEVTTGVATGGEKKEEKRKARRWGHSFKRSSKKKKHSSSSDDTPPV